MHGCVYNHFVTDRSGKRLNVFGDEWYINEILAINTLTLAPDVMIFEIAYNLAKKEEENARYQGSERVCVFLARFPGN